MRELGEGRSCELNAVTLPTAKNSPPTSAHTPVRRRGVTHVYLDVVKEGTLSFTDRLQVQIEFGFMNLQ